MLYIHTYCTKHKLINNKKLGHPNKKKKNFHLNLKLNGKDSYDLRTSISELLGELNKHGQRIITLFTNQCL